MDDVHLASKDVPLSNKSSSPEMFHCPDHHNLQNCSKTALVNLQTVLPRWAFPELQCVMCFSYYTVDKNKSPGYAPPLGTVWNHLLY